MTFIRANHYKDIPADKWPWPHFTPEEMACRGTGRLVVSIALMDKLEALRKRLGGRPLVVTSGYRSKEHNAAVGGAANSQHLYGQAVDIALANADGAEVEGHAKMLGFTGIGRYPGKGVIHLDIGPARTWGRAWPKRPTRFSEERQLEPSKGDKAIAIGSTAGSAATGVAGVLGVAQSPMVQVAMIAVLVLLAVGAFVAWRKGWLS
jgi:zinc D-Ala-D-Ala carboxypeptidase